MNWDIPSRADPRNNSKFLGFELNQCTACGVPLSPEDNDGYCGFCRVVVEPPVINIRWHGNKLKPRKKRKK
jgi:hypothetical protein